MVEIEGSELYPCLTCLQSWKETSEHRMLEGTLLVVVVGDPVCYRGF